MNRASHNEEREEDGSGRGTSHRLSQEQAGHLWETARHSVWSEVRDDSVRAKPGRVQLRYCPEGKRRNWRDLECDSTPF